VNPILAGTDHVIIAGPGRLLAARKLGMKEVPVIVLDGLNENQRRAPVGTFMSEQPLTKPFGHPSRPISIIRLTPYCT